MNEHVSSPAFQGASWIAAPQDAALPLFRRKIYLDAAPTRAVIAICGLGQYELRVNGQQVDHGVMTPAWTDYRRHCLYHFHDITGRLHGGENVLGVLLGNGMFHVTGGRYVKFKGSFGHPTLIARLEVQQSDGKTLVVVSDAEWRTYPGPITFSCIYGGEDHDASLEPRGWDAPGFADADWAAARAGDGPGGELIEQDCPPVRVMQRFAGKVISEPRPGVRVYDLGQNIAGWPGLTMQGVRSAEVRLVTGELLDDEGCVNQANSGAPVYFSYRARGDQVERWSPRFSYTGFRYIQAEGDLDALVELQGQLIHADVPVVGAFECSNALLNRIHQLIVMAIRSNMQSVFTDCPHREKLGWLEQLHLVGPGILHNFDALALYGKVCRDMRDAQRPDGCVPTIAPQYTAFKPPWDVFNDSPEWGSSIILVPWMVYRHTGRKEILRENYPAMRRYASYLASRANDMGILEYGLGDWYDIGPGNPGFAKLTSAGLTATAIWYQDLLALSEIAQVVERPLEHAAYLSQAQQVRRAFNRRFFDASARRYDTASQTACGMPLALGLCAPEDRAGILRQLIDDIRAHQDHITAGDIGHRYVLLALAAAGRSDVIFDLLRQTTSPSYGAQLARGATTLTEAWDANPGSSQNHFMLGHAEEWFYIWLAGIQLDLSRAPGERLVLRPTPVGDVGWVRCSLKSAVGEIRCDWERDQEVLRLDVQTPIDAVLHWPDGVRQALAPGRHRLDRRF